MPIPVLPEITKSSARRLPHQHFKCAPLLIPETDLFEIPTFCKSRAVTWTMKSNFDNTRRKLCFNMIRIINFQSYVDWQV